MVKVVMAGGQGALRFLAQSLGQLPSLFAVPIDDASAISINLYTASDTVDLFKRKGGSGRRGCGPREGISCSGSSSSLGGRRGSSTPSIQRPLNSKYGGGSAAPYDPKHRKSDTKLKETTTNTKLYAPSHHSPWHNFGWLRIFQKSAERHTWHDQTPIHLSERPLDALVGYSPESEKLIDDGTRLRDETQESFSYGRWPLAPISSAISHFKNTIQLPRSLISIYAILFAASLLPSVAALPSSRLEAASGVTAGFLSIWKANITPTKEEAFMILYHIIQGITIVSLIVYAGHTTLRQPDNLRQIFVLVSLVFGVGLAAWYPGRRFETCLEGFVALGFFAMGFVFENAADWWVCFWNFLERIRPQPRARLSESPV